MKYFIIFLFSSIYLTTALAFETGRYFSRIDEINAVVQTAYRSYSIVDSSTGHTINVRLIGITHKAIPEFYKQVEELIKDKVVLYELFGSTLEMVKEKKDRIMALLSPEYKNRYINSLGRPSCPNSLGQVSQEDFLSYIQCKELIHADAESGMEIIGLPYDKDELSLIVEQGNSEALKNLIDTEILNQMENFSITCNESTIDENLPFLNEKFEKHCRSNPSRNVLSIRHRKEVDYCNKDIVIIRKSEDLHSHYNTIEKFIKVDRNDFIFTALNDLWNRDEIPTEIAIVYGAGHLPIVEDYLLRQGFKPVLGSDSWLTVAKIVPLPPKFDE